MAIRYPTSTPGVDTPLYHRMLPQKSPSSQRRQFSTSTWTPTSTNATTLKVTCQCASISFSLPYAHLQAIYHCHCTQCRKQSASAFGTSAILPASDVFPLSPTPHEKLRCWTRPTKKGRKMDCYFCKECEVRVMHRIIEADGEPRTTISVKGGVLEGSSPGDWNGAKHI